MGGTDPRQQYVMPVRQRSAITPLKYVTLQAAPGSAPTAFMKSATASYPLPQKMAMAMHAPCHARLPAGYSAPAQNIPSYRLRMLCLASPQRVRPRLQQQLEAQAPDTVERQAVDEVAADEEAPLHVEQEALIAKQEAARKTELETKEKAEEGQAAHKTAQKEEIRKAEEESLQQEAARLVAHHKAEEESYGRQLYRMFEEDARKDAKHDAARKQELELEEEKLMHILQKDASAKGLADAHQDIDAKDEAAVRPFRISSLDVNKVLVDFGCHLVVPHDIDPEYAVWEGGALIDGIDE